MRFAAIALATIVLACAPRTGSQPPSPQRASGSDTADTGHPGPGGVSTPNADRYPSTYKPFPSRPTLIKNVTILTAAGPKIEKGSVLLRDGKIAAVGHKIDPPTGTAVLDGTGKCVTPGLIDTHSHLGVYPAPGAAALGDGNEATNPVTANVWAEHSVWPQDPQFPRVLAGGVTTIQVLPGSANLFGGRSVTLKVVPSRTVQGMKFPGAKYGLKMACG
jgi:imidazolonepropionase-like amidohydrolase